MQTAQLVIDARDKELSHRLYRREESKRRQRSRFIAKLGKAVRRFVRRKEPASGDQRVLGLLDALSQACGRQGPLQAARSLSELVQLAQLHPGEREPDNAAAAASVVSLAGEDSWRDHLLRVPKALRILESLVVHADRTPAWAWLPLPARLAGEDLEPLGHSLGSGTVGSVHQSKLRINGQILAVKKMTFVSDFHHFTPNRTLNEETHG